ncbi:uncharacterized protein LOC134677661 [Cydia fagiglandana]|uniref:uncharacterized protein LOC134677661 n=1 Tax=Cydia fagiglandana TaxID=1458189 RepID=UPI002FEE1243
MYYFCAICMINTETLLDLNPKCRRLFEAMVSPYIEFKEGLKSCRILLCRDCNQVLGTMLKFQQTVVKGVMNLVALQKRSKMIYHNLPEVISAHTDLLLPVVNEEYVLTTNSIPVEAEDSSGGNYKNKKTVVRVSELSKPSKRNLPKKLSPPPSKLRKRRSETKKTPIKRKRQRKAENAESVEDLDTTLSGDSDCYFSGNLDTEPGYERLVAKSQMDHDYFNNKNDMAVLVPINNTRDKIDSTNTNESSEVKKTKLNRQLYQAIKLALESRSISDFDIAQYEPESESDFDHNIESHHDLTSPHDDLKSPQHDLKSPQHNAKSLHDSPNHDSKSSYLEKNSLHHDLKSAQETNSLHHDPKSPDLETNSPDLETNSLHHHSKSASYLEINSLHHDPKSPDLKTNSIYHHSKSAHHDTKSPDLDSSSHHVLESSDPDSESTVSCESDYEDAEHFPNIMLAKAFSGVADGRGVAEGSGVSEGSAVSEGVQKKAHLVLNPPSEWPCTGDSCHGHTHSEGHSSDSDVIADEDTGSNVKRSGKRRRKECKLCEKTFVSLYALWEHYEREHVDICRKECCNGTMMKNGNTRRLLQVKLTS